MRTNIDLDAHLVEQALQLSKAKTKKEVVTLALDSFVKSHNANSCLPYGGR